MNHLRESFTASPRRPTRVINSQSSLAAELKTLEEKFYFLIGQEPQNATIAAVLSEKAAGIEDVLAARKEQA